MNYRTLRVRDDGSVCFVQIHRPDAANAIDDRLIAECRDVVAQCMQTTTVLVLEGLPDVFCSGADFGALQEAQRAERTEESSEALYELWRTLATGPFLSVAHVRGKVTAGGVGFAAACDVVLADASAQFTLTELLFGVLPACVLPFLIRRVGFQRANYMTLTTQPVSVQQAHAWGLVDGYDASSEALLRRQLPRLRRLSKASIVRYKRYTSELVDVFERAKPLALGAYREAFADPDNRAAIRRYVEHGTFPWEA